MQFQIKSCVKLYFYDFFIWKEAIIIKAKSQVNEP